MINKFKFFVFILRTFKSYPYKTKLYIILRILIYPHVFLEKLKYIIDKDDKIIDIGCGYGIVPLYLRFSLFGNKILGIDIEENRINDLNKIFGEDKNISFQKKDLINDSFTYFDDYNTAILVDLLHHIDEKTQFKLLDFLALKNISKIIIKDIDIKPKYKYYWNYFHDKILMRNNLLCFLGSNKILEYLKKKGYNVEYSKIPSIFPYPHYLLVAKK